jgi:hypothetical protein
MMQVETMAEIKAIVKIKVFISTFRISEKTKNCLGRGVC